MSVKAKPARGYLARLLLIAGMCTFMCAWFLYDGFVKYPNERKWSDAWVTYGEKYKSDSVSKWNEDIGNPESEIYGFPPSPAGENPGKQHSETSVATQRGIGFGLAPLSILTLGYLGMFLRKWIGADEQAVTASGGVKVPYDRITELDKSRWRSKGIAVLTYNDPDAGINKRLTLDDWKFEQGPTTEILEMIEDRIDHEKITGGVSEAQRRAEEAEAEAEEEESEMGSESEDTSAATEEDKADDSAGDETEQKSTV